MTGQHGPSCWQLSLVLTADGNSLRRQREPRKVQACGGQAVGGLQRLVTALGAFYTSVRKVAGVSAGQSENVTEGLQV